MKNSPDLGLFGQESRHCQPVGVVLPHPIGECAQAAVDQPRIEGSDGSTQKKVAVVEDLLQQLFGADDSAGDDIAVSTHVLGCGVDDQTG